MFTDTYLPSRDGVITSLVISKRELERLGHEVFIFAPDPKESHDRQRGVHYFRSMSFTHYEGYRIPVFPTNKGEILQKLGIDVIHSHGLLFQGLRAMFAGRTRKLPVVTTFHTMVTEAAQYYNFTPIPHDIASKLIWIYLRSLLQRSEAVIAPTEAIKQELLGYAPGMRRIEVIPTGIDYDRFHLGIDGSAVRYKFGMDGEKLILHVGRIAREKNLDLVLSGFRRLSREDERARLMVVGDGPARRHYTDLAKEMGIEDRTIFTGFVPDVELPQYYAACDIFTLASKFETQGIVILEAMACGKPVVGINFRAVAEIIRDGETGYLFEDDPESWRLAALRALNSPKTIGEAAALQASHYSSSEAAERLVEVYEWAIASKKARVTGKH